MELLDLDPERDAHDDLGQEALDAADDLERAGAGKTSQATQLLQIAAAATLWHTPSGDCYASVTLDGHVEHWPIRSRAFRQWLAHAFFEQAGKGAGAQATQDALTTLEGRARFVGEEHPVFVRLAEHEGEIFLDLGDPSWRAVRIDAHGWEIVDEPPVRFRRARGSLPLPVPTRGGKVESLRRFIHATSDDDWRLTASWLVAALRPSGPYAVLSLTGEQGSAKTTAARLLRALVDPNEAPVRSEPRNEHDLAIGTRNGWVVGLDNVSHLTPQLSDALCRIATGGGFAARTLYSDDDEEIFTGARPIITTSIGEVADRSDLLDRAVVLALAPIPESERRTERDLWSDFERERPAILGALLDAVSTALRNLPHTKLQRLPRMADFAVWACAAAPALGWTGEQFLDAYTGNRQAAHETALEALPWLGALRLLRLPWEGTASQLLDAINRLGGEAATKAKGWPANAKGLSGALRRAAPNLRAIGIAVAFPPGHHPRRIALGDTGDGASLASLASPTRGMGGTQSADRGTQTIPADDLASHANGKVPPSGSTGWDARDARDALSATFSNGHTNGTAMVDDGEEIVEWTL